MAMTSAAQRDEHLDAGELFRQHGRFVARFLYKLGAAADEIDDLVQEVFMVAHARGGFVVEGARPTTWLARICLRVAAGRRRSARRRPETPSSDALPATPSADRLPCEELELSQAMGRVQQALDSLDLEHRTVFVLYELEQESCADISAGLDLPIGTVHSRLFAARKKFVKAHARLVAMDRWSAPGGIEP
jgi:RNA polymerase sigma-70 factor, ECF subfamily